ncbi:hypothetical protein L1267_16785 [Pseudoalteromonas sp. OFAV1]|jgi:NADH:ubiquinone oxidoreductase subunit E|uniref:hypothetical protein n=1 Tax=Pseudoalteromonas sp. OFAV1 TaxID=2908892 RepID=UPI001F3BB41B|nr:hypothetical protein [Pseudoalteromonas sp. OFAV1]MCF2902033.1 hypothetical protein [Pseudoalteromonas sp. OFAV1]
MKKLFATSIAAVLALSATSAMAASQLPHELATPVLQVEGVATGNGKPDSDRSGRNVITVCKSKHVCYPVVVK